MNKRQGDALRRLLEITYVLNSEVGVTFLA